MKTTVYGFIYSGLDGQEALHKNQLRQQIQTDTKPWFVYYDAANIPIKQWPGQLWFVKVIKAFSTTKSDCVPAITIQLLKRLPCSLLFGPKGADICLLMDKICQLTLSQVERLASLANPISEVAYATAWNCWLQKKTNLNMHYDADHTNTLAIGEGEDASPIYNGFLTIRDLFYKKAKELADKEAFSQTIFDDELSLPPMWSKACSVLLQSAMGLGAEQYTLPKDLPLLLMGWELINKI